MLPTNNYETIIQSLSPPLGVHVAGVQADLTHCGRERMPHKVTVGQRQSGSRGTPVPDVKLPSQLVNFPPAAFQNHSTA